MLAVRAEGDRVYLWCPECRKEVFVVQEAAYDVTVADLVDAERTHSH